MDSEFSDYSFSLLSNRHGKDNKLRVCRKVSDAPSNVEAPLDFCPPPGYGSTTTTTLAKMTNSQLLFQISSGHARYGMPVFTLHEGQRGSALTTEWQMVEPFQLVNVSTLWWVKPD